MSGTSHAGQVTVDWHGAHNLEVHIRPGAFGLIGFTDAQLAAEVGSALAAAVRELGRRLAEMGRNASRPRSAAPGTE